MAGRALGAAFGLTVAGLDGAPGLAPAAAPGPRHVALAHGSHEDRWDARRARRIADQHDAADRLFLSLDEHPADGFRLWADGFGAVVVSADGRRVLVDSDGVPAERWQRHVYAQALPLCALLQGLEPFHASAVAVDGGAIGFLGASRVGKSSLAVRATLRGARFLCDDVLAVELRDGLPLAWPGPAVAGLRHAEHQLLDPGDRERLGHEIGRDEDEVRYALAQAPAAAPLPLRALALPWRDEGAREVEIVADVTDPALLLGATFSFVVQRPERLERQLDVCARLFAAVRLVRVRVPASVTADQLAARLLDELG